jgi:hypothetical protein
MILSSHVQQCHITIQHHLDEITTLLWKETKSEVSIYPTGSKHVSLLTIIKG